MNKKTMVRTVVLSLALLCSASASRATETENQNLQILPAPGKVTIDGKIDDWDLTGGIFACGDVEDQRTQYATWFYAMYDKDNLYLLARWIDRTPLNNPGSTLGDFGWSGDALQVRIVTRPGTPAAASSNLTCWKGVDGRDVVDINSPFFGNPPQGVDVKPQGARQAFSVNPDGSGYTQEIAIPWKLLAADGYAPVPGDSISLTIEPNFTLGAGGRLSIKDIFRPGVQIDRVFTFQNKPIWGVATLSPQGHVPVRPVRLSDARTFPVSLHGTEESIDWDGLIKVPELQGFVPIEFNMPGDGYISLNIRDANGVPVRQLLNQAFYSKGPHEVKWDGLATMWFRHPGAVVPAGHYTWNAIYNPGIDMKLRGWADNSGRAPWDGGPTTNWGGEGPPDAVATDGASMYLGWAGSEAGKAVVATDLDGNVRWRHKRGGFGGARFIAADNGIVYVLDGDTIYLLNAKDGTYHAWAQTRDSGVDVGSLWGGDTAMPAEIDGMDVRDNVLYVSSSRPGVAQSDVADWMKLLGQLRDGAVAGNALDKVIWDHVDTGTQGRIEAALKADKPALLNGQAYQYDDARDVVRAAMAREPRPEVEAAFPGLIKHIRTNFIAAIDCKTGRVVKIVDANRPGKLKVAGDKIVFVSNGASVCTLNPQTGALTTIAANLTDATDIAAGPDGSLYVGIGRPTNQVRVYDAAGKLLRTIGRPGGRQLLGPWQPDGMIAIAGLCLDPRGHLWVAEEDGNPSRISEWDTVSGKLVKEFFGATHYGASGGAIDPRDPNIMVGEGCEWAIDPATGHGRCTGVFDRDNLAFLGGESFDRFAQGSNGRLYLMALCGQNLLKIFERVGEGNYVLRGTVSIDRAAKQTTFWSDRNGDGQVQPEETGIYPGIMTLGGYYNWSLYANTDMTLYPELGKDSSGQFKVAGFTACGAPRYDLAAMAKLPFGGGVPSLDNRAVLTENWSTGSFEAYDVASGKMLWNYPSQFIGVHGSHNAPPPETGMIRGAFGVVGSATVPGAAGTIWAINTNVGEWHLLTGDGFYLTHLFQGDPFKIVYPDPATPGADVDNVPPGLGGEDFGGSLMQANDGKLYVEAGKTADWNIVLTGVDAVRGMPGGKITIADSDIAKSVAFYDGYLQSYVGPRHFSIATLSPQFTGNLDVDFKGADTITFQKTDESLTHSAAAWDANNLYLAWNVRDNTPWTNAAADPAQMYLSGDTVDFQLGTDAKADPKRTEAVAGDLRLSIGNFQGKPTAVLYRKVSAVKQPMIFSSGVVHAYPMDYVAALPDANIKVTVQPGHGYTVEAAIPLHDLDLTPTVGTTLHGDFGVTFGDPNGQRTRLRSYWANQHTGIVDDAVYELMMEPQYWGELQFGK